MCISDGVISLQSLKTIPAKTHARAFDPNLFNVGDKIKFGRKMSLFKLSWVSVPTSLLHCLSALTTCAFLLATFIIERDCAMKDTKPSSSLTQFTVFYFVISDKVHEYKTNGIIKTVNKPTQSPCLRIRITLSLTRMAHLHPRISGTRVNIYSGWHRL